MELKPRAGAGAVGDLRQCGDLGTDAQGKTRHTTMHTNVQTDYSTQYRTTGTYRTTGLQYTYIQSQSCKCAVALHNHAPHSLPHTRSYADGRYNVISHGRRSGKAEVQSSFENHKACARRMKNLSTASCRSQGAPSDRTTYQSPILQEVRFCHFSGVFRGYSVIFGVGKLCFWRDLGGFYNRIQKLSVQLSTHSL